MSTLIEVRQSPDQNATTVGLDKYNRSKFPGTFERVQPAKSPDGRWITGLDEDSVAINRIEDKELRMKTKAEKLALREELERLTGLDLRATSSYWNTYFVTIIEKLALNFDIPSDRIKYYVLLANKHVAPEEEAKIDPEYSSAKFYMHRSELEDSQKSVKSRERDKAVSDLYNLYDSPAKLKLIGRYVAGTKIKDSMSVDAVYNYLRAELSNDKEGTMVRKFNEATAKTIEELQYKLIIDEAIAKHVIRIREGYYQRGNATYGKTMKDTIAFLTSPENANEFASVKEEVEEKRALG